MGRPVHLPEAPDGQPSLELALRHDKAGYLYRFYGADGRARVEVLKDPYAEVAYHVMPPAATCGCRGYGYRQTCKHHDTVLATWSVFALLVSLYHKHGRVPMAVDVRQLASVAHEAAPAERLQGTPS